MVENRPNIAVIDDDKQMRDLIIQILNLHKNCNVFSFENGSLAWEYLKKDLDLDVILSDTDMPEMNGFELLSRIKGRYPKKIFILMSGDPSNAKAAKELGADVFLEKPFEMADLFKALQRLS
jgi:DNA-binding NtrC family response regulator